MKIMANQKVKLKDGSNYLYPISCPEGVNEQDEIYYGEETAEITVPISGFMIADNQHSSVRMVYLNDVPLFYLGQRSSLSIPVLAGQKWSFDYSLEVRVLGYKY